RVSVSSPANVPKRGEQAPDAESPATERVAGLSKRGRQLQSSCSAVADSVMSVVIVLMSDAASRSWSISTLLRMSLSATKSSYTAVVAPLTSALSTLSAASASASTNVVNWSTVACGSVVTVEVSMLLIAVLASVTFGMTMAQASATDWSGVVSSAGAEFDVSSSAASSEALGEPEQAVRPRTATVVIVQAAIRRFIGFPLVAAPRIRVRFSGRLQSSTVGDRAPTGRTAHHPSMMAMPSISTSISSRGRPVKTVVREGRTPLGVLAVTKAPYASFMMAKSSRFVRYTRSMTTSSNVAPEASTMALTFSSVRVVCAATSPGYRYSLVTGSTGPWPDTCTNGPLRTPCENVWAGAGAVSVEIRVFVLMAPA